MSVDCCKEIIGIDDVEEVHIIDRKPLAKNAFSFIATYLSVFLEIRKLFSAKYTAKMLGLDATSFFYARKKADVLLVWVEEKL